MEIYRYFRIGYFVYVHLEGLLTKLSEEYACKFFTVVGTAACLFVSFAVEVATTADCSAECRFRIDSVFSQFIKDQTHPGCTVLNGCAVDVYLNIVCEFCLILNHFSNLSPSV